jgi:hypothetical protein
MTTELSQEQYWKIFKELPEELQKHILSEDTAKDIYDICLRNEIDDMAPEVAEITSRVLFGLLPIGEFQKTLEKELELDPEVAKKVYQEIFRFIFYPVKESLEEIYKTEIAPIAGVLVKPPVKRVTEEKPETSPEEKPKGVDRYREPIE